MHAKGIRKRMYRRVILQQMHTTKWAIFTDARNGLAGTNVHKVWPGGKKVRTTCILDARNFFNQVPGRSYYKNAHWQSEVWVWPVNATQSWRRVQGQHQLAPKPTSRPIPHCVARVFILNTFRMSALRVVMFVSMILRTRTLHNIMIWYTNKTISFVWQEISSVWKQYIFVYSKIWVKIHVNKYEYAYTYIYVYVPE